ncbi:MAG: Hsp20/alpha crystallin family protein [Desulfobacter sp.]|nr:Hsp20/alpha crystallin family protein [Desulfobacter sp.]WDP86173.1 MAG: Hsp20/alpha crystallin family protein [Desulfobacter sp.]
MRLVKYNPLNDFSVFQNTFNDFFTDPVFKSAGPRPLSSAVDIVSTDETVLLFVELPGLKKEDIQVNIEDKVLTISGERKDTAEDTKENYLRRERKFGQFKRAFTLSDEILSDEVTADYVDGVLKVTLKKETTPQEVKQITVN